MESAESEARILERIVAGELKSDDLPERFHCSIDGFHADYNRTIAAEVLLARSKESAFESIIKWIKDLVIGKTWRHWTACNDALGMLRTYVGNPLFEERLKETIPYLRELGKDGYQDSIPTPGWHKAYARNAIGLIVDIGGEQAISALREIIGSSSFESAKLNADKALTRLMKKEGK